MVKKDKSAYNTPDGNCTGNSVVPSVIGTRGPQNVFQDSSYGALNFANGDSVGNNDIDINARTTSYYEVTNNNVRDWLEENTTCTKLSKGSTSDSVPQYISTSVLPCNNEDNVPSGGVASASYQSDTVPPLTPEETFNLEEKKNPTDGNDYLFLPSAVGHRDDYKEKCTRERTLSLIQHQERLFSPMQSGDDFTLRFNPTHHYEWPDLHLEKVKVYCKERFGFLIDKNKKDLGTCWHIGEGNVVTCYHCIPETALRWPKRLKWGCLNVLFPYAPLPVPIFNVQDNLPSASAVYDFAVLKLIENGPFPPAFEHYYLFNDIMEEFPIYNIGYQLNGREMFGELIVDKSVVVQKPSERKVGLLNDYMKSTYGDIEGYAGLLNDWNVCQLTSLIQGASGGLGVRIDPNTYNVEVVSMYQKGYPKYYYKQTIEQRKMFEPLLKVESGISMEKLFSEMTLGI